jgi:hypothetical protein
MYVKVRHVVKLMGCVVLPSKIHLNNILPWSLTKKFKINEIQSKYQKKEKNQKKYGSHSI